MALKTFSARKTSAQLPRARCSQNFIPPYESHVTQQLWDAGAVCLGKLNMDEFAMGSRSIYTMGAGDFDGYYFKALEKHGEGLPVVNPWRSDEAKRKSQMMSPGGSSGGASAAVAAQLCLGAIASDTGGSIRQPAAWTGTVGIKPTYGCCSRYGMIAFASSLDQAGVIAKNVQDAAILLKAIAGHDDRDSTSAKESFPDNSVPNYEKFIGKDLKGLKVGVIKDFEEISTSFGFFQVGDTIISKGDAIRPVDKMMALWEKSKKWLQDAGAEIVPVSLPNLRYALPAYYIIAPAEASSNLARYDGVRYGNRFGDASDFDQIYEKNRAHFGKEVKRRILLGTYVLSAGYYDAYYLKALKVRALIAQDFAKKFKEVDLLLTPTTPSSALPSRGINIAPTRREALLHDYLQDIMTVPANLAGLPAISVPVGLNVKGEGAHIYDEGMPLGMQLIAPPFEEARLFQAAQVIENAAKTSPPPSRWWEKADG